jgi:hypothetical protein
MALRDYGTTPPKQNQLGWGTLMVVGCATRHISNNRPIYHAALLALESEL